MVLPLPGAADRGDGFTGLDGQVDAFQRQPVGRLVIQLYVAQLDLALGAAIACRRGRFPAAGRAG